MIPEYILAPIFITTVLLPLTIWSVLWKGVALWRAAQHKQTYWFVALLIINTAGILEIAYLLFFAEKQPTKKAPYTSNDTAISKTAAIMENLPTRQQAIVSILMNLLDTEHQNAVSQQALDRMIEAIEKRLDGTMTQPELLKALDADSSRGGAGLYTQTAHKIASHIDAIIKASKK